MYDISDLFEMLNKISNSNKIKFKNRKSVNKKTKVRKSVNKKQDGGKTMFANIDTNISPKNKIKIIF